MCLRDIYVFGDSFWEFYTRQSEDVQTKIDWVIGLVRTVPIVPDQFFKHLQGTDGLYEIRVSVGNNSFRIFCFFDAGKLIILLNGFQKKENKTPRREIRRALKLMKSYFDEKEAD